MQFKTLKKACLFPLCSEPFEMLLLEGHAVYCFGVSLYLCVLWDFVFWDFNSTEIKPPQFCRYQDYELYWRAAIDDWIMDT